MSFTVTGMNMISNVFLDHSFYCMFKLPTKKVLSFATNHEQSQNHGTWFTSISPRLTLVACFLLRDLIGSLRYLHLS